jgi:hypothetical protein
VKVPSPVRLPLPASGTGLTASYAYDAQGRRKSKTVIGVTTIFVTDADNREVLEYDGTSGAIQNWYAYGLGPNTALAFLKASTILKNGISDGAYFPPATTTCTPT